MQTFHSSNLCYPFNILRRPAIHMVIQKGLLYFGYLHVSRSRPDGRLDYQPLFGKGARVPPPNGGNRAYQMGA